MLQHLRHGVHAAPLLLENRLTELTYFTTDICNMKCRHCFVHDALNNKMDHLTLDEIREISKHLTAMQRVHLGGGEPFTRTDVGPMTVEIANNWRTGIICVPTNGWFTDRVVEMINHYGPRARGNLRLHFSINAPDPRRMDEFTRLPGTFDRWRKTVDAALEAARAYDQITIVALTTFNEENQDNFIDLIDWLVDEVGVDDVSFHLVRSHGGYTPKLDLARFREANAYYFRKHARQNPVLAAYREAWRNRSADYYETPGFRGRCKSGKIRLLMAPNGDLYPCETLGYPNLAEMRDWLLGNIRDFGYDLNAAARSQRAAEIHGRICSSKCHCEHNIDQNLSALTSGTFRRKVVGNTLRRFLRSPASA